MAKDPKIRSVIKWLKSFRANSKCVLCGSEDNIEFHHLYPKGDPRCSKWASVSEMARSGYDIGDVKDEINKTVPLCSKCHSSYHQKLER